jgi:hypothetical protein
VHTSEAVREADPEAKVLIAGAAGGSEEFVRFYRGVFKNEKAIKAFDIANVHCISNDDYGSFNVEPYKKLLEEFNIKKPIWVTEAEAMISTDHDINATQTLNSVKKALSLGAKRIFFTRYDFRVRDGEKMPPESKEAESIKIKISGSDPVEAYQEITSQSSK